MAKVTSPLMSGAASGTVGKSIVFFSNKGRNVVRQYVTPVNRMSSGQGDTRVMLGGTGRAVGEILQFEAGTSNITQFMAQLITLGVIPAGQSKQSFLVKYIKDHYITDATAYGNELSAYNAHSAYSSWESEATALGLVSFSLTYANISAYKAGFGLYLIAKASIALGFTGTPYTTALASWTLSEIQDLISDIKTA